METKFYICPICGQIVSKIKDTNIPIVCCGKPMQELIAGTVDASLEKHVPVFAVDGDVVKVNIGEIEHPMVPEHYIEWVFLKTSNGQQIKYLTPTSKPYVEFLISKGDTVEAVYAYCNLHGLWKA